MNVSFFNNACFIVRHALFLQLHLHNIKFIIMKPIDFPQSVKVLQKPATMTDKECCSLPVWSDGKKCVSCWKPTFTERLKIAFGGNIWLGIFSGGTQPPVFVAGEEVFEKTPFAARIRTFFVKVNDDIHDAVENVKNGFKQPDKKKHFVAGFTISIIVGILLPWLGLLLGCIAGALKEWWDSKGHGMVELLDFVFTCLGALCAFPIAFLIHSLIFG